MQRRTLCAVVLATALLLAAAALAQGHGTSCKHDSHVVPFLERQEMGVSYHPELDATARQQREARPLARGPIRFNLRTNSLYNPAFYCAKSDGTGTAPDFLGGTVACGKDTVLTATKRDILLNKLLPAALKILSDALHMTTLTTPIKVAASACRLYDKDPNDETAGVANADFLVYVSAAPTDATTVGIGGMCSRAQDGTPNAGFINVSPLFLTWDEADPSKQRNSIRSVAHELMHALGFSKHIFIRGAAIVEAVTARGKPAQIIKSPSVVARYRAFSGCATVASYELTNICTGSRHRH